MTVGTLIEYLQFFDVDLEILVCKRTKAKIPILDPWKTTEEEVEVPVLCAPTSPIECLVHDKVIHNAAVLIVI